MAVRSGRPAGAACKRYRLALLHILAFRYPQFTVMPIQTYKPAAMVNHYAVAITAQPAGIYNRAAVCRGNRRTGVTGNIITGMVTGSAEIGCVRQP